jgi:hypothetical protein
MLGAQFQAGPVRAGVGAAQAGLGFGTGSRGGGELRGRGLRPPLLVISDGAAGMKPGQRLVTADFWHPTGAVAPRLHDGGP